MLKPTAFMLTLSMVFSAATECFAANPAEEREAPKTSVDVMTDPQRITDEEFFGVWDSENNTWVGEKPILRYNDFPLLSKVEEIVKNTSSGDYSAAKDELLKYYRDYRDIPRMQSQTTLGDGLTSDARAAINDIIGTSSIENEFEVDDQWAWRKVDVSVSTGAYMIWALDKIGSDTIMYSKENGIDTTPYLDIQTSQTSYRVYASQDTYIRAGINRYKNYGSDTILRIREDGMPLSDFTKRAYVYFDLEQYDLTGLKSATLNIYAKTEQAGKTVRLSAVSDTKFVESELNWNTNTIAMFNYQDTMFGRNDIFDWTEQPNAMSEWINGLVRMGAVASLGAEYERSGNELYAQMAVNKMLSFYHYRQQYATRILDSTWRTNYIVQPFFSILDSKTMTPEVLTALIKFMSYTSELAIIPDPELNNRGTVLMNAAFTLGAYFPEVVCDNYWELVNEKAKELYSTIIFPNRGGYIEATTGGYPQMVLKNILNVIKLTEDVRGEAVDPYWYQQANDLGAYLINVSFPNGDCVPYGDNSVTNHKSVIASIAEYTGDEHLRYFATSGKSGTPKYSPSALSEQSKVWMMKTDFANTNALALFGNADNAYTHRHLDDLSIDVYGYGNVLLREAGNREYDSGTEKAVLPTLTENHNTITIDGLNQMDRCIINGKSNVVNGGITTWVSNDIVDYVDAYTNAYLYYPNHPTESEKRDLKKLHTRKILFLKELGFWIVSDIVQEKGGSDAPHDYTQTWSPNVGAAPTVNEETKTMKTHYESGGNIQVVPADPDELVWDNGEPFSRTYIDLTMSEKLMYKKEGVSGDVTFDTVLYPTKEGTDADYEVTLDRIEIENVPTTTATAFKINISDNETAYYYNAHDKAGEQRTFDKYTSDGDLAFINEKSGNITNVSAVNASVIKDAQTGADILSADDRLKDVSVSYGGEIINLETSNDLEYVKLRLYAPQNVRSFTINGEEAAYIRDGDYIVKDTKPAPSGELFSVGDYITMGTYNNEDILWRVVDIDPENGPLVVSDKGLTKREYDAKGTNAQGSHARAVRESGSDYWADSNIRDWLNSDSDTMEYTCGNLPSYSQEKGFLTNFSDAEKAAIKTVQLKNLLNPADADYADGGTEGYKWSNSYAGSLTYGGSQGANYDNAYYQYTEDRIFIPDVRQIDNMYNNKKWLGDDYYMARDNTGSINIGFVRTPVGSTNGNDVRVTLFYDNMNQVRNTTASNSFWI